jgi:hypothetical protein
MNLNAECRSCNCRCLFQFIAVRSVPVVGSGKRIITVVSLYDHNVEQKSCQISKQHPTDGSRKIVWKSNVGDVSDVWNLVATSLFTETANSRHAIQCISTPCLDHYSHYIRSSYHVIVLIERRCCFFIPLEMNCK